ncbi:hypothetical protein B0H14DRAFT_1633917 [Mycena olivaceomarginata]|nr:hypothetical protein B0H14DRAFT_1633917 [Mycena olivaceomarginata]
MAAILFTRTIHCPWCSTQVPVSQGCNLQSFVSCSTCGRKFSTSSTNHVRTETVVEDILEEYARELGNERYEQSYLLVDEYTRPETVSRQFYFRLAHLMLMPLDLARAAKKKPPVACLFCQGRKIARGPPSASGGAAGGSGTTSGPGACNQCRGRSLGCKWQYPVESRRGMRKKKAIPEGPTSASGSSSLPSSAASDMPVPKHTMDEIQRAQDDLFYATFPEARLAPARQARVLAVHAAIYAPAPECVDALPSQLALSAPLN